MSKASWILHNSAYIVEMRRWGEQEGHSYIAGVFQNLDEAHWCGIAERSWRAGKYEYVIWTHKFNEWRNGIGQGIMGMKDELYNSGYDLDALQKGINSAIKKKENTIDFNNLSDFRRRK